MTFREWFDINKKNLIFTLVVEEGASTVYLVVSFEKDGLNFNPSTDKLFKLLFFE